MTSKEFEQQLLPIADAVESFLKSICRDQHLAQDIVQDVYLKLWMIRKNLKDVKDAKAYLFKTARNKLIDSGFYKQSNIIYNDQITDHINISSNVLVKDLEQKEMVDLLKTLLNQLPVVQKEIIHLRDFCCFSNTEVAKIIGESEVYVRVNLSRGRKQLKELMLKKFQIDAYEIG